MIQKDTDRERRVLLMALRHVLQERDDHGIHDVIDQIRFRDAELPGLRHDARLEVISAIGKNEHTVATWVPLFERDER